MTDYPMTTDRDQNIEPTEYTDYITFAVSDVLLGIPITNVDEINRNLDVTPVPHAPPSVVGVLNLRGDVVTIIDLARVLDLPQVESTRQSRVVIVRSYGERIGLRVDRIADVVRVSPAALEPVPCNMNSLDIRFFRGVYRLEEQIMAVLDVEAALAAASGDATVAS